MPWDLYLVGLMCKNHPVRISSKQKRALWVLHYFYQIVVNLQAKNLKIFTKLLNSIIIKSIFDPKVEASTFPLLGMPGIAILSSVQTETASNASILHWAQPGTSAVVGRPQSASRHLPSLFLIHLSQRTGRKTEKRWKFCRSI